MITTQAQALEIKDGELLLNCTKPTNDQAKWGQGAVPQTYTDGWTRLVKC